MPVHNQIRGIVTHTLAVFHPIKAVAVVQVEYAGIRMLSVEVPVKVIVISIITTSLHDGVVYLCAGNADIAYRVGVLSQQPFAQLTQFHGLRHRSLLNLGGIYGVQRDLFNLPLELIIQLLALVQPPIIGGNQFQTHAECDHRDQKHDLPGDLQAAVAFPREQAPQNVLIGKFLALGFGFIRRTLRLGFFVGPRLIRLRGLRIRLRFGHSLLCSLLLCRSGHFRLRLQRFRLRHRLLCGFLRLRLGGFLLLGGCSGLLRRLYLFCTVRKRAARL